MQATQGHGEQEAGAQAPTCSLVMRSSRSCRTPPAAPQGRGHAQQRGLFIRDTKDHLNFVRFPSATLSPAFSTRPSVNGPRTRFCRYYYLPPPVPSQLRTPRHREVKSLAQVHKEAQPREAVTPGSLPLLKEAGRGRHIPWEGRSRSPQTFGGQASNDRHHQDRVVWSLGTGPLSANSARRAAFLPGSPFTQPLLGYFPQPGWSQLANPSPVLAPCMDFSV